eukprot:gene12469-15676_t
MVITTLGAVSGLAMGGMRISAPSQGAGSSNVASRVSSRQNNSSSSHRSALSSVAPQTLQGRTRRKEENRPPDRLAANQLDLDVYDLSPMDGTQSSHNHDGLPEELYLLLDPSQPVQLSVLHHVGPLDNWKLDKLVASLGRNRATWRRALVLYEWLKDSGHDLDDRLCTTLIRMCADHGDTVSALNVYEWMRAPKRAGGGELAPTNYTYTAAMRAAMGANILPRALQIWEDSVSAGASPDCRLCLTYIEVCTRLGYTERAMAMYTKMRDAGSGSTMTPTVHVYTSIMRAVSDGGQWLKALDVWNDMLRAGCEPTGHAYAAVISACASGSDWVRALALFEEMSSRGIRPDVVSCTALITALASAGEAEQAQKVVEWMLKNKLKPNVRTYTALIRAMGNAKEWTQAMEMLYCMQTPDWGSVQPNAYTYSALLKSLGEHGQWQLAEAVFSHLEHQVLSLNAPPSIPLRLGQHPQCLSTLNVPSGITPSSKPSQPSYGSALPTWATLHSPFSFKPTSSSASLNTIASGAAASVWSSASQLNGISLLDTSRTQEPALEASGSSAIGQLSIGQPALGQLLASSAIGQSSGSLFSQTSSESSPGTSGSLTSTPLGVRLPIQPPAQAFSLFSHQPNGRISPPRLSPRQSSKGFGLAPGREFPLDITSDASPPLLQSLSIQASATISDQLSAMSAIASLGSLAPPSSTAHSTGGGYPLRRGKAPQAGEKILNEVVCGALMFSYERAGKWEEAVRVLDRARALGLKPNHVMYNMAISAAGKAGKLDKVEGLFEQALERNTMTNKTLLAGRAVPEPDTITYETLIAAYGMAGLAAKAEAAFRTMVYERGLIPRDYAYCGLIASHSLAGDTKSALGVRQRMLREGNSLTVHVYNALIAACERGGMYEQALELHRLMQREGLEPNLVTQQLMTVVGRRGGASVEAAFAAAGSIVIKRGLF